MLEQRIARMETRSTYDEEGTALEKKVKYMQEEYDNQLKCAQTLTTMVEQFMASVIGQCDDVILCGMS